MDVEQSVAVLQRQVAALERQVQRLSARRGSPFALARTTNVPDDSGAVQTVQARLDTLSTRDAIPILYHYGFFSVPPPGSDMHVAFLDGDRSKAVIIASNNQGSRFKGAAEGDVGLFALSCTIHLSKDGVTISDQSGSTVTMSNDHKIAFACDQFTFNGKQATFNASVGMTLQTPILSISQEVDIALGPLTVGGTTVVVP